MLVGMGDVAILIRSVWGNATGIHWRTPV